MTLCQFWAYVLRKAGSFHFSGRPFGNPAGEITWRSHVETIWKKDSLKTEMLRYPY
jgi:hypothetical protein